jgi:hypothetical protein
MPRKKTRDSVDETFRLFGLVGNKAGQHENVLAEKFMLALIVLAA